MSRADILDLLKANKVKITNERREIISVLKETKLPLSPAAIFLRVTPKLPKANLTTVYRNLEMLEGLGIVKRLILNKTNFSYELISGRLHHHHLICRRCGRIEDSKILAKKFIDEVVKSSQFKIEDHNFEFLGLCETCLKGAA